MHITDKISLDEAMPFLIIALVIIILLIIVQFNRSKRRNTIVNYSTDYQSTNVRNEIKKPEPNVNKGNPVSPIKPKGSAGIR